MAHERDTSCICRFPFRNFVLLMYFVVVTLLLFVVVFLLLSHVVVTCLLLHVFCHMFVATCVLPHVCCHMFVMGDQSRIFQMVELQ